MTAKESMKNDTKQTLISLSLAGAIGYYLYNKLVMAGGGVGASQDARLLATRRTEEELNWRPEPVIDEQPVFDEHVQQIEQPVECVPAEDNYFGDPQVTDETYEPQQTTEEYVEEPVVEEATPNLFDDAVIEETPVEEVEKDIVEEIPTAHDFQMPVLGFTEQSIGSATEEVVEEVTGLNEEVPQENDYGDSTQPGKEVVAEQVATNVLVCPACGFENADGCKFCNNCGNKLISAQAIVEEPVEEDTTLITPTLDFGNVEIQLPNIGPVENIQPIEEVQPIDDIQPVSLDVQPVVIPTVEEQTSTDEDVSLDELENEEDTSVEDLFGAVNETVEQPVPSHVEEPQNVMENTEQLHKVDQKDESSRQEFKSILDFFAANGLT